MARKAQSKQDTASNPTPDASQDTVQQMAQAADTMTAPAQTEAPATQVSPSAYSACGGALRQIREKQGLSVHDVSTNLRLSNKQIEAIEADHFHQLPQPSIVRGFIRNYAKMLKVDSDPIIAAYNALIPNATPQSFTVKSNTSRSVIGESKVNFSPKLFLGLIILFGLIAALFYYYTAHIKPSGTLGSAAGSAALAPKNVELNGDVTPNNTNTEFALPAAQRQAEGATPNAADASTAVTSNTTEIALPLGNNTTPAAAATPSNPTSSAGTAQQPIALPLNTPPVAAPTSAPMATPQLQTESSISAPKPAATALEKPATPILNDETTSISDTSAASGQKTLSFTAHEETWVNIVNSRGKKIYSKVLTAGQTETIAAATPLKIIVGNAKSTTLTMNGQAVDLATHTRSKVARLTVE
jgi:cytoskeleton protein RodZ